MRDQLFLNDAEYDPEKVQAARFPEGSIKPRGGLWTSTFVDGSSDWVNWCISEDFGVSGENAVGTVLKVSPQARVLHIRTIQDFEHMVRMYQLGPTWMDKLRSTDWNLNAAFQDMRYVSVFDQWLSVGEDFDGLHLASIVPFRFKVFDFYGWDVESTLWFRPKESLSVVEVIRPFEMKPLFSD
jgi:hypothetical protein